MRNSFLILRGATVGVLLAISALTGLAADPSKPLIDLTAPGATERFAPNTPDVPATVTRCTDPAAPGINVSLPLGGKNGYPGVILKPEGAPAFDLSGYGHVEVRVVNTGTKVLTFCLRLDNAGDWKDSPWNAENLYLQPGASGTDKVYFGYSFGKPAYPLKPAAITQVMLFAARSDVAQSFRIESIQAGGPAGEHPAVDPNSIRIKPPDNRILGQGVAAADLQFTAFGASATVLEGTAKFLLKAGAPGSVTVKPAQGRWDLRDCLEARVELLNDGVAPVTPSARIESNGGSGPTVIGEAIAPGAKAEIIVPFINPEPGDLANKETLNKVTNDAISGVTLLTDSAPQARSLEITSIRADLPPTPTVPDWLGQRPPVDGDWVKTFDDEFDGTSINTNYWNLYSHNWWDPKKTHWSKDEVIVGGGVARIRYEKKTGHHNDDPAEIETPYATGYLSTYDKWTQRYGYFESRMKLPAAPGLWPAFWLVPDRGPGSKDSRQDTKFGGMEFDIMEHLTRWGVLRYNIANHWDGYEKEHKANGCDKNYVQPDKDGYITCGFLWTPGKVVYYCNGRELAHWENERVSSVPEYIIYNQPSGGWDNNSLDDSKLPSDFIIDYVRVWQRRDLASLADRPAAAATTQ